jgi:nucleoside diphosphate kinase
MGSGPVCAMVWEGRDAVKTGRAILGATNPLASSPGTIRGDYAIVRPYTQPPLLPSALVSFLSPKA